MTSKITVQTKPEDLMQLEGDTETMYAIVNLTKRQIQVLISFFAAGSDAKGAYEVQDGYSLYSDLFDALLEEGFKPSELSPYNVFTSWPNPYKALENAADMARSGDHSGAVAILQAAVKSARENAS